MAVNCDATAQTVLREIDTDVLQKTTVSSADGIEATFGEAASLDGVVDHVFGGKEPDHAGGRTDSETNQQK